MKIILIGFMGSGKSSVAKALAAHLQWPLLEMDEEVFRYTACADMGEVFQKGGEALLRKTEREISASCRHLKNIIISTGGGIVLHLDNLKDLKEGESLVMFLKASFETIAARVSQDPTERPLFKDILEAKKLYDFREPLYEKYADEVIEVDKKTIEEILENITSRKIS